MITVSTSRQSANSYHHGDLRAALVAAGLNHLESGGEADISLRQLAREVGVSATAVYRHFPDKKALLGALANEGYARLGSAQRAAVALTTDPAAGFAISGRTYVRFALENPALFRLTFTHSGIGAPEQFGQDSASELLMTYAREIAGPQADRLALQAWSLVHGLAMLMLDGQIPQDPELIDQVVDYKTLFQTQS